MAQLVNRSSNGPQQFAPFDTSVEADRVQREVWRTMGPDRRVEVAMQMSEEVRQLALDGLRDRNPSLDESGLVLALIELWHGRELADMVRSSRFG